MEMVVTRHPDFNTGLALASEDNVTDIMGCLKRLLPKISLSDCLICETFKTRKDGNYI